MAEEKDGFEAVTDKGDVREGELLGVDVDGQPVVLARVGGQVYAMGGLCTHMHGPLAEGILEGDVLECPIHRGHFNIKTGEAVKPPPREPEPVYDVKESKTDASGSRASREDRRASWPPHRDMSSWEPAWPVGRPPRRCARKDSTARSSSSALSLTLPMSAPSVQGLPATRIAARRRVLEYSPILRGTAESSSALDREGHAPELGGEACRAGLGNELTYDKLLIATGVNPRELAVPGSDLPGITYLRTLPTPTPWARPCRDGRPRRRRRLHRLRGRRLRPLGGLRGDDAGSRTRPPHPRSG